MSALPRRLRMRSTVDVAPGTVVDDKFRIVAPLGSGGMGAVFEAVNLRLDKRVALKVIRPELAGTKAMQRFLREAKVASRVEHRNVVEIHDFGELADGRMYYVMEYLQGRDLSKVLAESGRLRWPVARSILLQTVRGVKAAHDAKIIHRDIKPANVFLLDPTEDEPGQRVKVLDFGIAKADDAAQGEEVLTGSGDLLGTAWYMAPERALGTPANVLSDVYAMGVLMYQVLTGRVPFDDNDTFSVLLRHVNEQPRPLRERAPDVPEVAAAVVMRCLAKDPAARFDGMRALEHALSSVGEHGEAVEPSTKPPAKASAEPQPPPLIRPPARTGATEHDAAPSPPAIIGLQDRLLDVATRSPSPVRPVVVVGPAPILPEHTAILGQGGPGAPRVPKTLYLETGEAPPSPEGTAVLSDAIPIPPAARTTVLPDDASVPPPPAAQTQTTVLPPDASVPPSARRSSSAEVAASTAPDEVATTHALRRLPQVDKADQGDDGPTLMRPRPDLKAVKAMPLPELPRRAARKSKRGAADAVPPPPNTAPLVATPGPVPSGAVAAPNPVANDASGPRPVARDVSGPVAVATEVSGPMVVGREVSGPMAVGREVSGPMAVGREVSGPMSLAPGSSGVPRTVVSDFSSGPQMMLDPSSGPQAVVSELASGPMAVMLDVASGPLAVPSEVSSGQMYAAGGSGPMQISSGPMAAHPSSGPMAAMRRRRPPARSRNNRAWYIAATLAGAAAVAAGFWVALMLVKQAPRTEAVAPPNPSPSHASPKR